MVATIVNVSTIMRSHSLIPLREGQGEGGHTCTTAGDCDQTDVDNITNWTAGYDVRYDLDLDGNIQANDASIASGTFQGTTLGLNVLTNPDIDNARGYAGYRWKQNTSKYEVRHRDYDPHLGRWTRRDPAGYMENLKLYCYVGSTPIPNTDPSGLGQCGDECDPNRNGWNSDPVIRWLRQQANCYKCSGEPDEGPAFGCTNDCDHDCGAFRVQHWNSGPCGTVSLCIDSYDTLCFDCKSGFSIRQVLIHELVHAWQYCEDKRSNGDIPPPPGGWAPWSRLVCMEIGAETSDGTGRCKTAKECCGGPKNICKRRFPSAPPEQLLKCQNTCYQIYHRCRQFSPFRHKFIPNFPEGFGLEVPVI